eukprot:2050288-Pyramimonas_sp.AAC.1
MVAGRFIGKLNAQRTKRLAEEERLAEEARVAEAERVRKLEEERAKLAMQKQKKVSFHHPDEEHLPCAPSPVIS